MRLIVSTCGTSLLTNRATSDERSLITRHANARKVEDIPDAERPRLQSIIERANVQLHAANLQERAQLSAEFNGLLCFYGGNIDTTGDLHWLIATDTWLGQQTASILQSVLETLGQQAQVRRIADLRTGNLEEFRLAMAELVRLCAEEIEPMGLPVIFNLTGGFKSVQGFMQTLGMLYADETVYVFEGSHELLRLPRLPLKLDTEETVRQSLRTFQRMAAGLPVSQTDSQGIPEIFLFSADGQTILSEWGQIVWEKTKRTVLGEQLWPAIDPRLRHGDALKNSLRHCSRDELVTVNERLAQLARHLQQPGYNPRQLDFKKLAITHGTHTHECDAWSTGSAKRLFGHFEGSVFVVSELAAALH